MLTSIFYYLAASRQFHHYYIYGEFNPCQVEKKRIYNCMRWKTMGKNKEKAYVSNLWYWEIDINLFVSRKNALLESLKEEQTSMRSPDVPWKLRNEPPSDWKH